jgi:hypothetical protein
VIDDQQRPHSASGSPTVSPQARQRGGSTASTTARPMRRSWAGRTAGIRIDAIIDTPDQRRRGFVDRVYPIRLKLYIPLAA